MRLIEPLWTAGASICTWIRKSKVLLKIENNQDLDQG